MTWREPIADIYRRLLAREPDAPGLEGYAAALVRQDIGLAEVEARIAASDEAREVERLRLEITRRFVTFALRQPTESELRSELASARVQGSCGCYRPLNVEMDVTTQCNIRCVMCHFSDPTISAHVRHDWTVAEFEMVARQVFPFVQRLSLSISTEPLLNARFVDFLPIVASYRVPHTYINTNGLLLTEAIAARMIETGFHAVSISLDGATAATYQRIRRGGTWTTVIANIQMLRRLRERAGSATPRVTLGFVLMRGNLAEAPAFVQLARELGVHDVHFLHLIPYSGRGLADESLTHAKELCDATMEEVRQRGAELGVAVKTPAPFGGQEPQAHLRATERFSLALRDETRQGTLCPFPWHFVGIDGHGNVLPCGTWAGQAPMGNLTQGTFLEIWNGKRWHDLRNEWSRLAPRAHCQICPAAAMGSTHSEAAFRERGLR